MCTVSILIIEWGNWSLEKSELTCPGLTAINCQSRWHPGALFHYIVLLQKSKVVSSQLFAHLVTFHKLSNSPSPISLAVPIPQAVGREEHREWGSRLLCELQYTILKYQGGWVVPKGCLAASQGQTADLWLCFTWSPFFYHVSICIHKEQWGLLGKKYSHKREVTPYSSLCDISLVKIDITMSFLMQSPLVSLPSRRKPLNQKHLSTVIKLSPLRPHSLPLFWPLPGRNYLTF